MELLAYVTMSSLDAVREKALKLDYDSVDQGTQMEGHPAGAGGGSKAKTLTFELVSQHFSVPINQAARELNVGLTVLKERCRELGIPRWPHRKLQSVQKLIDDVQELGKDTDLTRFVVESLQETKKLIEERPEVPLDDKTKQLSQACYKETWKRKRGSRVNTQHRAS
ncbi:unnamed protein product [Urochloa decumbens]|uniref:RWP-RK domain-containing protein n=1 Tax=Urochloa decumbens TaxID=240449 RepID=A0ABC8ZUN1_9POAL